jgi:hypothetical protein
MPLALLVEKDEGSIQKVTKKAEGEDQRPGTVVTDSGHTVTSKINCNGSSDPFAFPRRPLSIDLH